MKENLKFNQKTFEKSFVIKNYKKTQRKGPKYPEYPLHYNFYKKFSES